MLELLFKLFVVLLCGKAFSTKNEVYRIKCLKFFMPRQKPLFNVDPAMYLQRVSAPLVDYVSVDADSDLRVLIGSANNDSTSSGLPHVNQSSDDNIVLCQVIFMAPKNHGILVTWSEFSLRDVLSWFVLLDYPDGTMLFGPKHADWHLEMQRAYKSSFQSGTSLILSQSEGLTIVYSGNPELDSIAVTLTAFRRLEGGLCFQNYFPCQYPDDVCISNALKCNGRRNCGDKEEESDVFCNPLALNPKKDLRSSDSSITIIIPVCLGSFAFLVIVFISVTCCCLHRKSGRSGQRNIEELADLQSQSRYSQSPIDNSSSGGRYPRSYVSRPNEYHDLPSTAKVTRANGATTHSVGPLIMEETSSSDFVMVSYPDHPSR